MLKLDEKEYNLDNLFGINFDLLKEILLKLSKSDNNILIEINELKNSNIIRDNQIAELEQKITELNNSINNIKNSNKEKEIKNILKKEKKVEITYEGNYNEINKEEKINNEIIKEEEEIMPNPQSAFTKKLISIEKINDLFISKEDENPIKENHANTQEINIKNDLINFQPQAPSEEKTEINEKNFENKNLNLSSYTTNNNINPRINKKFLTNANPLNANNFLLTPENNNLNENLLSSTNETIRNIFHEINGIKDRINFVEKNLTKKNSDTLKISKDLLSEHNIQSMSKFNSIINDLSQITSKQNQLEKALSHLGQKLEDNSSINVAKNNLPEIIQIFNNSNEEEENNNNKMTMTKTFFDSINKKFEFSNEKYLKLFEENHKIKQDIINIKGIFDNLNRQFDLFKSDNEDINDNIKRIKEKIKELNSDKNKAKNSDDILTMKNLEEINKYIDKKVSELIEQILTGKEDPNKKEEKIDVGALKQEKALINLLNRRLTQLNEKLSSLDEDIIEKVRKINSRLNEFDEVNNKIQQMNKTLKEKLEKKDLSSLYDINQKSIDEINNMKLTLEELTLSQEKIREEFPNFTKRLESLTYDMIKLKDILPNQKSEFNSVTNEYHTKLEEHNNIELSEEKIKSIMMPLAQEVEKLIEENKNINIKIKNISEENKLIPKKKYVENLENNLTEKIYSIENLLENKYLKKAEFQKILKTIDIQIKQLQGNNNTNNNINARQEGENWLLAKQPIKCFNCASCEANISNTLQQNEFLPWSKYHGQYRSGQGFSKLLKKLDNKNLEEKEKDNEKIQERKNRIFNSSFDNNDQMNNFFTIKNNKTVNKKIQSEDRPNFMSLKKYKLPRLVESFRRKQKSTDNIPISDDEKEEVIDIVEHSPQILKITKLKNDDIGNQNSTEINNMKNKMGRNSQKNMGNLNGVQSLPFY